MGFLGSKHRGPLGFVSKLWGKEGKKVLDWKKQRSWIVPLAAAVATWYVGGAGAFAGAGASAGAGTGGAAAGGTAAGAGAAGATAGAGGAAASGLSSAQLVGQAMTVGNTVRGGMMASTAARQGKQAERRLVKRQRDETSRLAKMAYSENYMGGSRAMLKARSTGGKATVG